MWSHNSTSCHTIPDVTTATASSNQRSMLILIDHNSYMYTKRRNVMHVDYCRVGIFQIFQANLIITRFKIKRIVTIAV